MKVLRSTLFVAATAIAAAACGDHVTVTNPPTPTPRVYSIQVAPSTVTLNVGQTANLTAAVNADPGVATTVNWSTSDGTKVTVAGGVVTAVAATPGVAICATSTVNTSVQACASVIVTAPVNPVPATVSIASITSMGNLNAPVPVPPAFVTGQIDVRLNLNPGTAIIDSAYVTINGKWAGSEVFSATQSAALRSAADEAVATQQTLPTVVISINTAAYNQTTGQVAWLNGADTVRALLGSHSGTIKSGPSASQFVALLFGNVNGFYGKLTQTSGNTANDVAGYTWRSGGITITAIPVIYTPGLTLRRADVTFGGTGCNVGGALVTTVQTAPPGVISTPAAPAITFAMVTTGYEFRDRGTLVFGAPGVSCDAMYRRGGEIPTITGVTNEASTALGGTQNNNLITVPGGFLNSPALSIQPDQSLIVRLDNVGPVTGGAIAIVADTMLNQTNWTNAAYSFQKGYTTPVDSGVSLGFAPLARQFFAGPKGTAGVPASTTISSAYTGTSTLTAGGLANSVDNVTYNIAVNVQDALSNQVVIGETADATPLTTHILATFGVDKQAPVLTTSGTLAGVATLDTATIDVGAGQTLTFNAVDSLSGFVATGALKASLARLRPNVTSGWNVNSITALDPTQAGAAATLMTTPFTTSAAGFLVATASPAYTVIVGPPIAIAATTPITFLAATPAGQYIAQAMVRDQAGNASTIKRKQVYVNDGSVPLITGLNAVTGPYNGGATVSFPASAQDSVLIDDGRLGLVYPALGAGGEIYIPANRPNPAVTAKFADAGGMPTAVPFSVATFVRNMQGMTASGGQPTTTTSSGLVETAGVCGVGATNRKPTFVTARVYNGLIPLATNTPPFTNVTGAGAATGVSGEFSAPILPTQVQTGVCFATAGNFDSLSVAIGASTVSGGNSTRTVTFTAWGAGGNQALNGGRTPFPAPFTSSQLSLLFNSGAVGDIEWVQQSLAATYLGSLGLPFPTLDNGAIRNYQWSFTVTRPTLTPTSLSVLGVSSAFDGLVTVPTLRAPAAGAPLLW